jgi:nucleotide-binding universal stress UspA family protein
VSVTTIAMHVEPLSAPEVEAQAAPGLALAAAFGAHLVALVFQTRDGGEDEALAAAAVAAAAERRGVSCEVRPRSSFAYGAGEVLADQARVSDMAVLSPGLGVAAGYLVGATVFDSGRPVLIGARKTVMPELPRRILVGWDASPAAARAVAGALPLIRRAAGTVVATVSEDKELRAGQSGVELTHLLARHGATATFSAVRADGRGALAALVECAREQEAELLVMGAVRHSPLHDLLFGSATTALFSGGAGIPVLVAA